MTTEDIVRIPPRFESAKHDELPEQIKLLVEGMKASRKGIYLFGESGTGKTHVAYTIAQWMADRRIKARFHKITDLLRLIRQDYNPTKGLVDLDNTAIGKLLFFDGLLVIDDLGAEKVTAWTLETLYTIIDKRYEEKWVTVITSNYSLDQLQARLAIDGDTETSDRICSRIAGMCEVVKLGGEDRRIKNT